MTTEQAPKKVHGWKMEMQLVAPICKSSEETEAWQSVIEEAQQLAESILQARVNPRMTYAYCYLVEMLVRRVVSKQGELYPQGWFADLRGHLAVIEKETDVKVEMVE